MGFSDYFKSALLLVYAKSIDKGMQPSDYEKKQFKSFSDSLEKNCKNGYDLISSLKIMKIMKYSPYLVNYELILDDYPMPFCISATIESLIQGDLLDPNPPMPGREYEVKLSKYMSKLFSDELTKKLVNSPKTKATSLSFFYNN
jgi:hypothetical protein